MATNWLSEKEVAEKLNRAPRTVRRKVKARVWEISYRTIEGRSYQYSEKDIERFLNSNTVKRA